MKLTSRPCFQVNTGVRNREELTLCSNNAVMSCPKEQERGVGSNGRGAVGEESRNQLNICKDFMSLKYTQKEQLPNIGDVDFYQVSTHDSKEQGQMFKGILPFCGVGEIMSRRHGEEMHSEC